ncbi:helix-turn-helix transcriptional regulator [Thermopolyspora sp. NPDC052614]|uniref:helix-turn-helix domain-containing protein n=1 Tax=Thermopolyspora sp. NPDC052614 TaxID=3155682 RepID=UPI003438F296
MVDIDRTPTVRLRRLGRELRRLREQAGKTLDEVASALEWSTAKLSRLENGHAKRPDIHHIRALCALYQVGDDLVDALVSLARDARKRGWWVAYKDVLTGCYVGLEAEATSIHNFEINVIPGLLQTADYIRAIAGAAGITREQEIERIIEARLERQQILTRTDPPPPQVWAVIDEAALLRPFGDRGIHERQLRKLLDTRSLEHIKVQILPLSAGLHMGLAGQFVILDFADPSDRSVVYLETATDGLYLEEPHELTRYRLMFQYVCASALSVDASIAHLSAMIDKL